jgi:hypothetical protein
MKRLNTPSNNPHSEHMMTASTSGSKRGMLRTQSVSGLQEARLPTSGSY